MKVGIYRDDVDRGARAGLGWTTCGRPSPRVGAARLTRARAAIASDEGPVPTTPRRLGDVPPCRAGLLVRRRPTGPRRVLAAAALRSRRLPAARRAGVTRGPRPDLGDGPCDQVRGPKAHVTAAIRRGVRATPRILVPMILVRILAAEHCAACLAHSKGPTNPSRGDGQGLSGIPPTWGEPGKAQRMCHTRVRKMHESGDARLYDASFRQPLAVPRVFTRVEHQPSADVTLRGGRGRPDDRAQDRVGVESRVWPRAFPLKPFNGVGKDRGRGHIQASRSHEGVQKALVTLITRAVARHRVAKLTEVGRDIRRFPEHAAGDRRQVPEMRASPPGESGIRAA